ncbi:MAG: phosphoenolpyruvate carboxykinase (ATP) [Candidatus Eremiobacteraeota bacterium]|nr:phosphoenolpyruvate carboxykinase (ATP) [Candidatus Eremiobacteraeota bacterium]
MKPNIFENPVIAKEMIINPSFDELREMAKDNERTTEFGSASYVSRIRSRSAKFTDIIYGETTEYQENLVREAQEHMKTRKLLRIDRMMGGHPDFNLHCRLYVPVEYAQIPFGWGQLLFDADEPEGDPDITVVALPDWKERRMLVDPKSHVTYLLSSDYIGEIKKANLRMAMYIAKCRGLLGLHAGSKEIHFKKDGKMVSKGAIFFGLSGTGKTTLTCHHHRFEGDEGVAIRQDDVIILKDNMYCVGTEKNFYVKTEGLEEKGQPVLYHAATSPGAVLENIWVDKNGKVDFLNYELTSNGRCVVYRADMDYTDDRIDLDCADIVIFITRRKDIVPPVAKLTPEQGTAFFMLGESIETSAGDPTKAGQSLRCVGTNPFIVGQEYEEGNIFLEILRKNPKIQIFLLNTGMVGGESGEKITIYHSTEIIKQIAKGGIKWEKDPLWGYEIPMSIDGMEITRIDPRWHYSRVDYIKIVNQLKEERRKWLEKFDGLDKDIINSLNLRPDPIPV